MYLHLGADCMVKNSEIIAVFNLRHPQSMIYNDYVEKYGQRYEIVDAAAGEEYASCVLTKYTLYLSAISSFTLKKRIETGFMEDSYYNRN